MVRSRTKLIRMRGENCVEASVSVIKGIANTMETTVIIDVATVANNHQPCRDAYAHL